MAAGVAVIHPEDARKLGYASLALSVAGIIITLIIVSVVVIVYQSHKFVVVV